MTRPMVAVLRWQAWPHEGRGSWDLGAVCLPTHSECVCAVVCKLVQLLHVATGITRWLMWISNGRHVAQESASSTSWASGSASASALLVSQNGLSCRPQKMRGTWADSWLHSREQAVFLYLAFLSTFLSHSPRLHHKQRRVCGNKANMNRAKN